MEARPNFSLWTVTVEPLTVLAGSSGQLRFTILREAGATHPLRAEVVDARLQCTPPVIDRQASGVQFALDTSPDSGPITGPVLDYAAGTVGATAVLPATSRMFLRFFLEGNNPIGFIELKATIEGDRISVTPAGLTEFLVPVRLPAEPTFVLFVTSTTPPNGEDEPVSFDLAVSRARTQVLGPEVRSLGTILNPYAVHDDANSVVSRCIPNFAGAFTLEAIPNAETFPGALLWKALDAAALSFTTHILAHIDADSTLLVSTEDLRYPWELLAPEPIPADVNARWLGQRLAMTRWLHGMPLPNDLLDIKTLGGVAPETIADSDGRLNSDRGEMYSLREFAAASRIPYFFEIMDGSRDKVLALLQGEASGGFLPDMIHLRAHGFAKGIVALDNPEVGAAVPGPAPIPRFNNNSLAGQQRRMLMHDQSSEAVIDVSLSNRPVDSTRRLSALDILPTGERARANAPFWNREDPPFLFFSACSIVDPMTTSEPSAVIPGTAVGSTWSSQLARSGCTGFVAAMWLISANESALASAFFYRDLRLKGDAATRISARPAAVAQSIRTMLSSAAETISLDELRFLPEIVRGGGPQIGFKGPTTPMAYAVFGHPNSRVILPEIINDGEIGKIVQPGPT